MDTVIYTGPRGNISVQYTVPAAPPGRYILRARMKGMVLASTVYTVVSQAVLEAITMTSGSKSSIVIRGRRFVPGFRLAIVAYYTVGKGKPIVLGMVRASRRGRFALRIPSGRLAPGQYLVRSLSVSEMTAQMAETVLEVNA